MRSENSILNKFMNLRFPLPYGNEEKTRGLEVLEVVCTL